MDVCVSAGGDSAGVGIRSFIQLLQSVTWERNSGLKQPYFCGELSALFGIPSVTTSTPSLQMRAAEYTPLAQHASVLCQVCRGIRGRSSSVKLCRRMLLSAMLGISRRRTEGRCRTVRKLIRCEVLPTLAIVRPELVRTVRTRA